MESEGKSYTGNKITGFCQFSEVPGEQEKSKDIIWKRGTIDETSYVQSGVPVSG